MSRDGVESLLTGALTLDGLEQRLAGWVMRIRNLEEDVWLVEDAVLELEAYVKRLEARIGEVKNGDG